MMQLPSEQAAVMAVIDPDVYNTASSVTAWVPLAEFGRFMAIVMAGQLTGGGARVDAKLQAATSSSGAGSADIPGAAITQLIFSGGDSRKQAIINLDSESLLGQGYTHFRLSMPTGSGGVKAAALILGFDPRYAPASGSGVATVDSITSV